jgi:hypothetical protein
MYKTYELESRTYTEIGLDGGIAELGARLWNTARHRN